MAVAGSGGAWYRTTNNTPGAWGNAYSWHIWLRSTSAPNTANYRGVASRVGFSNLPQDNIVWNHAGGSQYIKAFHHRNGASNYDLAKMTTSPDTNTWYSVLCTYDGTNLRMYVNGALEATTASSLGSGNDAYLAAMGFTTGSGTLDASSQWAEGTVAEFALWNTALSADDAAALSKGFRATRVRPTSLVFYAPFVRDLQDVRGGNTMVRQSGTDVIADHPRIIG